MAKALRLPVSEEHEVLDQLRLKLITPAEAAETQRWNQLVRQRHYLHNATMVGEQLRYAVTYGAEWIGLLGWSAPAWHLAARDAWLGWSDEQRRKRLHFVAQNSRFCLLIDRGQLPNLATRAMKLCLDRRLELCQAS